MYEQQPAAPTPQKKSFAQKLVHKIKRTSMRTRLVVAALVVIAAVIIAVLLSMSRSTTPMLSNGNSEVMQQYTKQLPSLKKSVENNAKDAEARKNYAVALYATGDVKSAKEQYEEAVKINSKDAVLYNNLGNTYRELKEYDKAVEAYKKALDIDPKSLNTYINLGNTQLYMKSAPSDAIATYQKGLTNLPNNVQLQSMLATAYERINDKDSARKIYNEMLTKDPNSQVAKAGLERLK